jgi:PDZ domain-containing protein
MRFLSPWRAAASAALLAVVALFVLYLIPSNGYYVFLPDRAHALAPLVHVAGEKQPRDGGGIYFVDVRFRKARLLEDLLKRPLARGATLEPAHEVLGGATESQQRRIDLNEMEESQKIAAALALNRLGQHVAIRLPHILVADVSRTAPVAKILRARDRLLAVDGMPVHTLGRLHQVLAAHHPGERVRLDFSRHGVVRTGTTTTIRDPARPGEAVLGILVQEIGGSTGRLPAKVRIDTGGVGGPSAGLAFALDLMEELGRDVDRGYKVAATGELELDGTVAQIGAIKQKTIGAKQADVDVFLVPAGANARDARKYAGSLRIIPVKTFPQALAALATLPLEGRMNG